MRNSIVLACSLFIGASLGTLSAQAQPDPCAGGACCVHQDTCVVTDKQTLAGLTLDRVVPTARCNFRYGSYCTGGNSETGVVPHPSQGPCGLSFQSIPMPPDVAINNLDHLYLQSTTTPKVVDFGTPVRSVFVFPAVDHGPFPEEGIESTVWGSDDCDISNFPNGWTLATLTTIWAKGWEDPVVCQGQDNSDDFVGQYTFPSGGFRYIATHADFSISIFDDPSHTTWSDQPGDEDDSGVPGWQSFDDEIDAVGTPQCDANAVHADAGADQVQPLGGEACFDASNSYDAGSSLSYGWDLDGNGTIDATGPTVCISCDEVSAGVVTLYVTDACGCVDTDQAAFHCGTRVSASQKGSLLMWSKLELRWAGGPAGALRQDTILELTNDYPGDVCVQLYFVNGDEPLDPVLDPVTGGVIVEGEPGWEWVDCQFCLTPDQTTYLSMATGAGAGCQPFTTLDPSNGAGPGRPDPTTPGERHLRGFAYGWAVDREGYAVKWNHLSGAATIVNYFNTDAWDYNAWAFQAHHNCTRVCELGGRCDNPTWDCTPVDHGERIGQPGRIQMDGRHYDLGFDMLLMDFFASGSLALSLGGPPPPAPTTVVSSDTDLTLHPITADLRQDSIGPVTTKAEFAIWNENERRFSGTTRCITCWDQTLLSLYGNPNHFLRANLQTDKGKARIDGVRSDVCDLNCVREDNDRKDLDINFILDILGIDHVCSYDASLLGVVAKVLAFSGAASGRATAGRNLVGMGTEEGFIKWDVISPPGTAQDGTDGLRNVRNVVKGATTRSADTAESVSPAPIPAE